MIKALCRYLAIFVFALVAFFWVALQTEGVQLWARALAISQIEEATGYDVSIQEINGVLPFFIEFEKIDFFEKSDDTNQLPRSKKVLSIDSIHCMPTWIDLLFGRISFLYLHADTVDLTNFSTLGNNTALPTHSFHVYLGQLSNVTLPREFSEPLLNNFHDEQDLNIRYAINGSAYWSQKKIGANVTIIPSAANTSPAVIKLSFNATPETTTAFLDLEAKQPPSGSVFISLPADQISFKSEFSGSTPSLLTAIEKKTLSALFSGKWSFSATNWIQKKAFASLSRFSAEGTLTGKDGLSFTVDKMSSYKLIPEIDPTHSEQVALLSSSLDEKSRGFSRINKAIEGTIQGNITFSAGEKRPKITVQISSEKFRFDEIELPSFSTSLVALNENEGWHGSFDLNASVRPYGKTSLFPVKSSFDWSTDGHTEWHFPHVELSICEYPVGGDVQLQLYPFTIQGKLSNSSSDASILAKELGLAAQGKANFSIEGFQNDSNTLKLSLDYSDFLSKNFHKIQGHFNTDISLKGEDSAYSFLLEGKNNSREHAIKAEGTLSSSEIKIATLIAQADDTIFRNDQAIIFNYSPKSFSLEPMTISASSGSKISARINIEKKAVQASLSTDNFPLEVVNAFFDGGKLFGSCSGHIELAGTRAFPKLSATFASSEFQYWHKIQSQPLLLMASGKVEVVDGLCETTLEIQGPSVKRPVEFAALFPARFSLAPFSFSLLKDSSLKASLQGEIEIDSIFTSLIEETTSLEGLIALDVAVDGTIFHPKFSGTTSWNQGRFFIPYIGSQISQIQMKGQLEDNKIMITNASGSDDKKGSVTGTGKIIFSPDQKVDYELDCVFSNFEIMNIDEATIETNATATLTGNLDEANVKGKAEVTTASFFISSDLSTPIPELEITYINNNKPVELPKKFQFGIDLDISMPGKGFVTGMGLESEWKGDVILTGKGKNLLLNGQMTAIKGFLEFGSKQFSLDQGKIEFKGNPFSESQLNLIASLNANQIITQILVRGPLEAPRIDFQSTPAMSQKEILSWVLFNKGSSEISALEGIQLAQVLLKLKGNSASMDFIEKLKQQIGIDRIDIGTPSSITPRQQDPYDNEVALQVGKYLSDGVIVTLSKDVTNEVNRLGVEVTVAKNIIAEANIGDDSEAQVSLQWKINY